MKCIDFALEITNGCQFNCSGCNIDKEGNSWPTDEQFENIIKLIDDFVENSCKLRNIVIGPTDISTSVNRSRVLKSEYIKKIVSKFEKVTINCAFLNPLNEDYVKLAEDIDWLAENNKVCFVIPFELMHIDNKKYLYTIGKRVKIVADNLVKSSYHKSNLLINYDLSEIYNIVDRTNITKELFLKFFKKETLLNFDSINISFPITRGNLRKKENSDKFLKSILTMKSLILECFENKNYALDVAESNLVEGTDWDITYKSGNMYMTPFIMEGITSFDEIFLIKEEWTMKGFYNHYNKSLVQQLNWTDNIDDCRNCSLKGICAERGVHNLMLISDIKQCISPAKEMKKYLKFITYA